MFVNFIIKGMNLLLERLDYIQLLFLNICDLLLQVFVEEVNLREMSRVLERRWAWVFRELIL